jgi:hypothetical protein
MTAPAQVLCACSHPFDDHVEILGCCYDATMKESGGVNFACACDEAVLPGVCLCGHAREEHDTSCAGEIVWDDRYAGPGCSKRCECAAYRAVEQR